MVAQPFLHGFQGGVVEHEEDVFGGGGSHDVVNVRGFTDAFPEGERSVRPAYLAT